MPSKRCVFRHSLALFLALCLSTPSVVFAQDASDIPLWFDVSSETPPNIKINTDATSQLQNEEQVAVDPTNPDNLVAVWRDFRLGFRQVGWGYSHDGGATWTEGGLVPTTPYNRDSDPGIVAGNDGNFYSVILSFDEFSERNGLFVPVSFDSGLSWFGPLIGVDTESGTFEDKEMIGIDLTGGPTDGSLYVPWARFGQTVDIFCVSAPGGLGFLSPVEVSDNSSVQWPTPIVDTGGHVLVAWFSYSRSAIMCDYSTNQGATWGTDRVVANTTFFPSTLNGGITAFAFPALASDVTGGPYNGRIYCAFTDDAADGFLDLYLTVTDDGGQTWTPRQRINDDPIGNNIDQFHPWIFVNKDGVVSVAWYDRRLDPANLNFDLFISHSFDGGATWTPNQRVSEVSSSPFDAAAFARQNVQYEPPDRDIPMEWRTSRAGLIGEYIGLATSERRATVVFTDTRNGNQDVYAANMPLRLFPPKLTGPADGLVTTDPNVSFTWEDWSIYDQNLTYALEYSFDSAFNSGVTRFDGLSGHSLATVVPEGRLYWRVRAFDTFGDSSDVVRRGVWIDATAPDAPTPLAPSPLSTDSITDPTPQFVWSDESDPNGTGVSYDLDIASDSAFSQDVRSYTDLAATSLVVPDADSLSFGRYWHWRVRAKDEAGNISPFSELQTFFLKYPYLVGDLNDDGFLDAIDLNLLVDVLFFNGQVPVPPAVRADINCDQFFDAVDMNGLIDVIFFGAAAPACP
ncbi:MAG: hypothetical protein Kow0074_26020 [Candidatus Zixiibacteriota bacterium]